tara:strand:- start:101080 stop:101619 length:540 start_codon:yes stop_codon:yes gene_type:complete
MTYICVYSKKGKLETIENIDIELDYYLLMLREGEKMEWSKLINKQTGEIIEEYHNFKIINPMFFNLNLNKKDFPETESFILLNKHKVNWFICLISRYSKNKEVLIEEIQKNTRKIHSKKSFEDGFFIPKDLIMIDRAKIKEIVELLFLEFEKEEYRIKILKDFLDLKGYELKVSNLFLK